MLSFTEERLDDLELTIISINQMIDLEMFVAGLCALKVNGTKNVLWDFSNAGLGLFGAEEFGELIKWSRKHTTWRGDGLTLLVSTRKEHLPVLKIYAEMGMQNAIWPVSFCVASSTEEALAWMNGPRNPCINVFSESQPLRSQQA